MAKQFRRMQPPLIPLPSPSHDCDPKDPFDSLFSTAGPSQPIFVPPTQPVLSKKTSAMSSSAGSDFGAFVSVPPSMDPLQQSLTGPDSKSSFPSLSDVQQPSEFFEQFTDGAKRRSGQNERRVLDELLAHQDDPLYWLNTKNSPDNQAPKSEFSPLIDIDSPHPPTSDPLSSSPHTREHQTSLNFLDSSHDPSHGHRSSTSPLHSRRASSLGRKWMSTILSSSVPSHASTTIHDPTLSISQHKTSLPLLTHSTPFAPHVFIPPSGAPGFTGDHQWNKGAFEYKEQDEKPSEIELTGRRESTTPVLTAEVANQLRNSLPALPRLAKSWSLLYSLDQHGVSLQTFYSRCNVRVSGTLIAIRDSEDQVFGVWMNEQVRISLGAYYGSGESFLWRHNSSLRQNCIEVFKWTGKNDYVALCETTFISFGGGEGKYGLYLDENLVDGSSARCSTFDNDILCSAVGHDGNKTAPFECVGIEAWGVAT